MTPTQRRAYLDALRELPAKTRAWLESDDPAIFCFYGWGVMLTDAQESAFNDILRWPRGTIHLWRCANRAGKTTDLVLAHAYHAWKKVAYEQPDPDDWAAFRYRTLHSAPLNRLTGKAWELASALINGTAWQQRSMVTHRQRPAPLGPFYKSHAGKAPDGSDILELRCANNSVVDFLSTQGGAGRLESETWWFIGWDEFARQAPVEDIPLLFDQTFLPRSSDHLAPVVLSSTVTEDSEPIYQELEDIAAESPKDWNIISFDRASNYSQSAESIDRQRRLTIDPAIAARSLDGSIGEGGSGTLFPHLFLRNAFDGRLPTDYSAAQIEGLRSRGYIFISSFDHAVKGDLNVVTTWAVPWPIPREHDALIGSITCVGIAERRSGSHLTPTLQSQFALDEVERFDSRFLIVDSTAEGGELVYRGLREELPERVIACAFNAKLPGRLSKNKELGLQALQRQLGLGLEVAAREGWIAEWPDPGKTAFGLYRVPFAGRFLKLHREMAVLRRDDAAQRQDRAMTWVQVAWYMDKFISSVRSVAQPFSIVGRKPRPRRRAGVMAR